VLTAYRVAASVRVSLAVGFAAVLATCGGGKDSAAPTSPSGPGGGTPTASQLAFSVQPTAVTAGATISPAVVVAVQDASGSTVTTATHTVTLSIGTNSASATLSGLVTVAAASGLATFSNLSIDKAGTGYTLTASASGLTTGTSAPFTVTAPAPRFSFPSTVGTRWLYSDSAEYSWCATFQCGGSQGRDTVLYVLDSLVTTGGRSALRLRGFPLAGGTNVRTALIAQDASGLSLWDGASWKMLLSATLLSWTSDKCWSVSHDTKAAVSVGSVQVTVPAGSFATARTSYSYHYSGSPYTVENLTETCSDYYADGVGLVRSAHDYSYHDVGDNSTGNHGAVSLLAFNAGAPGFFTESEPNDSTTSAQLLSTGALGAVMEGASSPTDAAAVVADPLVNLDTTGVRRIQDWYRISVTARTTLTLTLVPENSDSDFDLYLFAGSPPAVVAYSAKPAGQRELITYAPSVTGTVWIGVQNWNRKPGNRAYYLHAR